MLRAEGLNDPQGDGEKRGGGDDRDEKQEPRKQRSTSLGLCSNRVGHDFLYQVLSFSFAVLKKNQTQGA
jgi:hypothetical protein